MAKKTKKFRVNFNNGDYDILPKDYLDMEFDSVHDRWIFYHKNGRDHRYYMDADVESVKRI